MDWQANTLIRRMIKRYRWRKMLEAATAAADLRQQAQAAAEVRGRAQRDLATNEMAGARDAGVQQHVGTTPASFGFVPVGRGINSMKLMQVPRATSTTPEPAIGGAKQKKRRPQARRALTEHPGKQFGVNAGDHELAITPLRTTESLVA